MPVFVDGAGKYARERLGSETSGKNSWGGQRACVRVPQRSAAVGRGRRRRRSIEHTQVKGRRRRLLPPPPPPPSTFVCAACCERVAARNVRPSSPFIAAVSSIGFVRAFDHKTSDVINVAAVALSSSSEPIFASFSTFQFDPTLIRSFRTIRQLARGLPCGQWQPHLRARGRHRPVKVSAVFEFLFVLYFSDFYVLDFFHEFIWTLTVEKIITFPVDRTHSSETSIDGGRCWRLKILIGWPDNFIFIASRYIFLDFVLSYIHFWWI